MSSSESQSHEEAVFVCILRPVTRKISLPPKLVWPDQFWQPKLAPLANFCIPLKI